jgi:hypothetical protein
MEGFCVKKLGIFVKLSLLGVKVSEGSKDGCKDGRRLPEDNIVVGYREGWTVASDEFSEGSTDNIGILEGGIVLSTKVLLGLDVDLLEGDIVDFCIGAPVCTKGCWMLGFDVIGCSIGAANA